MTRKRWWWGSLAGLLLLAGVLGGCDGDDHDDHDKDHHVEGGCLLVGEREPNDTTLIAQILDPGLQAIVSVSRGTSSRPPMWIPMASSSKRRSPWS